MRKLLFIIVTIMAFTTCCKEECIDPSNPECENYDPCFGKERPSAKFIMEESSLPLANKGIWIQDSLFKGGMIRFRSELTESKYKHTWYVGSEVFDKPTTPDRNFSNVARPAFITISHVIEYEPDLVCFPDDDGKDSIAQTFRLIKSLNEFQIFGTFKGVLNGTTDSFDVKIISLDEFNQPALDLNSSYKEWFINFHNRGDTLSSLRDINAPLGMEIDKYNKFAEFTAQLEGTFNINAKGEFEMRYRNYGGIIEFLGDREWYTFKGRKIN